jgi:hypothetical protein
LGFNTWIETRYCVKGCNPLSVYWSPGMDICERTPTWLIYCKLYLVSGSFWKEKRIIAISCLGQTKCGVKVSVLSAGKAAVCERSPCGFFPPFPLIYSLVPGSAMEARNGTHSVLNTINIAGSLILSFWLRGRLCWRQQRQRSPPWQNQELSSIY